MADAILLDRPPDVIPMTTQGAIMPGKVWQLRNGRAGIFDAAKAAANPDTVKLKQRNQVTAVMNPAVALLDGGGVWWDRANGYATYKRVGANRGFFLGSAIGDFPVGSTECAVDSNVPPVFDADLARDPFVSTIVGTQALGGLGIYRRGGAHRLVLDATNEAQKVDALSDDLIITGSKGIVHAAVTVRDGGSSTHAKFYLGLASATHATDPTAVTEYLFLEIDSNNTAINFQSKDPSTTVPKTDSTKTYTVGTRKEIWFDLRDTANVKIYVDAIRVLTGTTFNLAAGASNLYLLAWLGKTSSTDTMDVQVDWFKARTAEQSVAGV